MPSSFQTSFANRYTKARELVSYLSTLPVYNPGVDSLTAPKLTEFLNDINTANSTAAYKNSLLQTERSERAALIKGEDGLVSRSSQVRDYLASILAKGKKAKDYERAQKIIQEMRGGTKPRKSSAVENGSTKKQHQQRKLALRLFLEMEETCWN
jgi:type I site-specific restriction endonuclease